MVDDVTVKLEMDSGMCKKMKKICGLLKDLDSAKTREAAMKVAKEVFDHMDLNNNGKLERKELLEGFRRIEVYEKLELKAKIESMSMHERAEKLHEFEEEIK